MRPGSGRTLVLLVLALLSSAVLARITTPTEELPREPARLSVDGIELGMTEAQVREKWGEVEKRELGTLHTLTKPGDNVITGQSVTLDQQGLVASVTGRRLREGGRLLLCTEDRYEDRPDLGETVRSKKASVCEYTGPLKGQLRLRGDSTIFFAGYSHEHMFRSLPKGVTVEQLLENDPGFSSVVFITLESEDYYERVIEGL